MDKLYKIGEVAKMYNISTSLLRHYEEEGLLIPQYIDAKTHYRYYGNQQLEVLNTICSLRALGISINDIKTYLEGRDIDKIKQMLQSQKAIVQQRMQELQTIEQNIDHRLALIDDALSSKINIIEIKDISPCTLAYVENSIVPQTYLDLETSIRELEKYHSKTSIYLGKIGISISQEHLIKQQFDQYDRVFMILDKDEYYDGPTIKVDKETCVTLRFRGTHKDAKPYYEKLYQYILDNHYTINGFSKEITYIDEGLTDNVDLHVTEIQIPIRTEF
ncbi:MAG: MerR family transcriptional regulator [Erysipelotrichaceae bacterium]|nr:MerR family transcriptional regulator [Erysipelotrichaceae bacterium]